MFSPDLLYVFDKKMFEKEAALFFLLLISLDLHQIDAPSYEPTREVLVNFRLSAGEQQALNRNCHVTCGGHYWHVRQK